MSECHDEVCITCADSLAACRVVEVVDGGLSAIVLDGDQRQEVSVELIGDVSPGDVVMVHGGVALQRGAPEAVSG